eukprot:1045176-Pelagomonas_calceolata.AAC.12
MVCFDNWGLKKKAARANPFPAPPSVQYIAMQLSVDCMHSSAGFCFSVAVTEALSCYARDTVGSSPVCPFPYIPLSFPLPLALFMFPPFPTYHPPPTTRTCNWGD